MDPSATLLTLCEVAIAIAGFTAIALAIRSRSTHHDEAFYRWSLQVLVASVAAALFFSALPLPFLALQLPLELVWAGSSTVLGAGNVLFAIWGAIQQRRRFGSLIYPDAPVQDLAFGALLVISMAACALNSLGIVFHREFGGYLFPLLVWFVYPLYTFFFLVLRNEKEDE